MQLFYVHLGIIYKLEQIDGIAKVYCLNRDCVYILIATATFAEPITYFAVHNNTVFINGYVVNVVTETLKLRPSYMGAPISLYQLKSIDVTYRSKLAVFADFTFIGPTFDEMKLKNMPINVNYKVDGSSVTETKSRWFALNYSGQSDDFIYERFSGAVRFIGIPDCYRNHVYREYELDIATCETCGKTWCGINDILLNCKPMSKVCIIPSLLYILNMSDGKCYLHALVDKKQRITRLLLDKLILYGDHAYHLSNKYTVMKYYAQFLDQCKKEQKQKQRL